MRIAEQANKQSGAKATPRPPLSRRLALPFPSLYGLLGLLTLLSAAGVVLAWQGDLAAVDLLSRALAGIGVLTTLAMATAFRR